MQEYILIITYLGRNVEISSFFIIKLLFKNIYNINVNGL